MPLICNAFCITVFAMAVEQAQRVQAEKMKAAAEALFDKYVPATLKFMKKSMRPIVKCEDTNMVMCLLRFLEAMLTPKILSSSVRHVLEATFVFAAVWAFGGAAASDKTADFRKQFSQAWKAAFKIISADPNVQAIMVNIFGGIMRCDIIARGVIAATEALSLEVPLVVRLAGTNVDEGKAILASSTLNIHPADDLAEGAQKIVALIGGEQ